MLRVFTIPALPWRLVYGPDEDAAAAAAAKAASDKAASDVAAAAAAAAAADDDKPTISQKKLNEILKKEKEKAKKDTEKQIADLESLRQSKSLTEAEKDRLAARIEELNSSMLTKEELAAKDRKKLQDEAAEKEKKLSQERDGWKTKYEVSSIKRAISDGAIKSEAYSPAQIVELLHSKARLVPVTDAAGNETGEYITKIHLTDVDEKDKKPVVLDLTVDEALKRMKERTDEFGNLFKSGVVGGLGAAGNGAQGRGKEPKNMTPSEYRQWRKTQGLGPRNPPPKS